MTVNMAFPGSCESGQVVTLIWRWEFLGSSKSSLSPLVAAKLLVFKALMELGKGQWQ